MLCPLPLSNYPCVGRLGLRGEVSATTQGASVCSQALLQTTSGYQLGSRMWLTIWATFVFVVMAVFSHPAKVSPHSNQNHKRMNLFWIVEFTSFKIWHPSKKGEKICEDVAVEVPSSVFASVGFVVELLRVRVLLVIMPSPWAPQRGAWPGRRSGRAGRGCLCGWPGAAVGWWRTWCAGSWCLWLHSQSASSPQSPCLWLCCLCWQRKGKVVSSHTRKKEV